MPGAAARIFRSLAAILVAISTGLVWGLALPAAASASHSQISIIQDDPPLQADPARTLAEFRALGATTVRVIIHWSLIAPKPTSNKMPAGFDATDPNAYPASGWAPYDRIVREAAADGIAVDLTIAGGAPRWAQGAHIPRPGKSLFFAWKPNASMYGEFVQAVGERYDGLFTPPRRKAPLPAVHFWALWNEPNFGEDLAPQAIRGSRISVAPMMYRQLVDAGFGALAETGHGHDTIVIGELAAHGLSGRPTKAHPGGLPGDYSISKPLSFVRTMYCLNSRYRPLRGVYARARGCPTTAAGSRRFRTRNTGLFEATGVGDHPYQGGQAPIGNRKQIDSNAAGFPQLARFGKLLDKVNRAYGSRARYPIYNDEFGYITRPPSGPRHVTPATAAYYLNWSEYVSWKNPRVASYAQYLLDDPLPIDGSAGFASGLLTSTGVPKATYAAYRLPLYLPLTSLASNRAAEVWGCARPAHFMELDTDLPQTVAIEFQPHGRGPFETLAAVAASSVNGYFDAHVRFPTSGLVRLAYTFPGTDPLLPPGFEGTTIHSRVVKVHIR
ncbi:MAG TPA: hypothetical protein VN880_06450 [Solirubrobacteraceae bacterium]|nr:hypothetical protein [Solirubrobacteraceae bacterium]